MSDQYICDKCAEELYKTVKIYKDHSNGSVTIHHYDNCPQDYKGFYNEPLPDNGCCQRCGSKLRKMNITFREYLFMGHYTFNLDYIKAMDELKGKDIIEFENKMQPVRENMERIKKEGAIEQKKRDEEYQQKIAEVQDRLNHPFRKEPTNETTKCPKCGGTNFTPVRKKFSLLTGFMTNKVELVCNNCGYRVKGK